MRCAKRSRCRHNRLPQDAQSGQALAPLPMQQNFVGQSPMPFAGQRNVDQVMMQFQQTMLQMTNSFLETQQRVMLSYLSARSGQVVVEPFNGNGNGNGNGHAFTQVSTPNQYMPQQFYPANAFVPAPQATNAGPQTNGQQPVQPFETQFASAGTNGNGDHAGESFAPAEAVAATTPAPTNDEAALDSDQLIAALLDIVSGRTGYPPDMLDPDLDLQADLRHRFH